MTIARRVLACARDCRVLSARGNLWWAAGYNALAFALAAGARSPFVLSPEIAALSMSGRPVIVAINALLLRRMELDQDERNTAMRQPAFPPSIPAGAA